MAFIIARPYTVHQRMLTDYPIWRRSKDTIKRGLSEGTPSRIEIYIEVRSFRMNDRLATRNKFAAFCMSDQGGSRTHSNVKRTMGREIALSVSCWRRTQ